MQRTFFCRLPGRSIAEQLIFLRVCLCLAAFSGGEASGGVAVVQQNRSTQSKVILAVVLAAAAALMYVSVFLVMTR